MAMIQNRADVHCYKCDEDPMNNYGDVLFDRVMEVLTRFGVIRDGHVVGLSSVNREKSLLEMNLLVNKDFEFSMVSMRVECNEQNNDQGIAYPVHLGPNCCGLINLGNSCYLNSILQVLFHCIPVVSQMESLGWYNHYQHCEKNPTECVLCQLMKVGQVMREGREEPIRPQMLKQAIGGVASEFNNTQQQGESEREM